MARLIALVVDIALEAWAIKRARTSQNKAVFAALTLTVFVYMVTVALTKSVIPGRDVPVRSESGKLRSNFVNVEC